MSTKTQAPKEEVNELKEEFNELVTKLQEIFPNRKYSTQKFCTRKLILFRNTYEQAKLKENKVKAKNHRVSKIEEFRLRNEPKGLEERYALEEMK
jgi:hypothetical protein